MLKRFLPKTQGGRDIGLLAILIVPLAVAGVIWGMFGDFTEPRQWATPPPISTPATPQSSPAVFVITDHA